MSGRKKLRERLKCHSFKWYLDNVFPDLFLPSDAIARGEVDIHFLFAYLLFGQIPG